MPLFINIWAHYPSYTINSVINIVVLTQNAYRVEGPWRDIGGLMFTIASLQYYLSEIPYQSNDFGFASLLYFP
jgi:hypothetical protein